MWRLSDSSATLENTIILAEGATAVDHVNGRLAIGTESGTISVYSLDKVKDHEPSLVLKLEQR